MAILMEVRSTKDLLIARSAGNTGSLPQSSCVLSELGQSGPARAVSSCISEADRESSNNNNNNILFNEIKAERSIHMCTSVTQGRE